MSRNEEAKALVAALRDWCGDKRENYGRRAEVAKAIGVTRGLIGDYLSGRSLPGYDVGLKLREFLKREKRRQKVTT
jgi:transcriptional regulator with XRE-family HTH domain